MCIKLINKGYNIFNFNNFYDLTHIINYFVINNMDDFDKI